MWSHPLPGGGAWLSLTAHQALEAPGIHLTNERYSEIFERTGMTAHPGGPDATRRLAGAIRIAPERRVLDVGCGIDYTACSLAKWCRVSVVAVEMLRVFSTTSRASSSTLPSPTS